MAPSEAVTAKLTAIEAAKDIEEQLKTKLLDLYRLAQPRLTGANQYAISPAAFDKAIMPGPTTVKTIQ